MLGYGPHVYMWPHEALSRARGRLQLAARWLLVSDETVSVVSLYTDVATSETPREEEAAIPIFFRRSTENRSNAHHAAVADDLSL